MKYLLKYVLLVYALSLPSFAQKQFDMNIVMLKDTFYTGEEVDIGLEIKNITDVVQPVNFPGTISIKVYDNRGNELIFGANNIGGDAVRMSKEQLKSGETDYRLYDLCNSYGNKNYRGERLFYFETGDYIIKVKVKSNNNYVEEKTIPLKIVEPSGDELVYFTRFKEICSIQLPPQNNKKLFIEGLENLHQAYPNSVYSPTLLMILGAALHYGYLKDETKTDIYYREIIEKYTWSGINATLIYYVLDNAKSKSDKINYLKKLHSQNIKGPMKKLIEKYIQEETN